MPRNVSYAHKIILENGPVPKVRDVVVYVGRHPQMRKYINGWVTFDRNVPVPIPANWAKALLRLGDNNGPMFKRHDGTGPVNAVTYAVKRNMGLGDVILVTPVLRAMRAAWPWAKIRYYVENRYLPVLRHNPDCEVLPLETGIAGCAVIFDLIGVSERDSHRMFEERIDVYARHVGVAITDRAPRVYSNDYEKAEGGEHLKEFGWDGKRPLLGVQLISSRPERDYDLARAAEIMKYWYDYEGFSSVVFHNEPIDWEWSCPVVDMSGRTGTVGRLMNAVANCSLFLGVDSGITHMAAAHGIPTVALTGAIRGELRYACYPNCKIVERDISCTRVPRECYSCHKGTMECMQHDPSVVTTALGEALCRTA